MSEILAPLERPASVKSAGHYMSYLWLGHCVNYPADYKRDISNFHQGIRDRNRDYSLFREKLTQGHGAVLLPQLQRIIKSAKNELGLEFPRDAEKMPLLKVHLIGEISVRGMDLAIDNRLIEEYPDLAGVTSPFVDGRLIDGALRIPRNGAIKESLINYATMERLLPGYVLPISVE
jgi:hypothetical protein